MPYKDAEARRANARQNAERTNALRRAAYPKHRARVIAAMHAWRIQKRYGITVEQRDALLKKQNNACALCKEPQGKRRLCVDHDHKTGKIRGLLCVPCNSALGTLGDSAEGLQRAIKYLQGEPDLTDILDSL